WRYCLQCAVGCRSRCPAAPGQLVLQRAFARQATCLAYPVGQQGLVLLVSLVNVEITHMLVLRCARRLRLERGAPKKCDLDVSCVAVKAEEPSLVAAVKGQIGRAHV